MRILHVFSGNIFTGAVEHVAELAAQQRKNGDEVCLMGDTGQEHRVGPYIALAIDNRSYPKRFTNVLAIKKCIKRFRPDVIHAHSRAASWVAKRACSGTKVALVSTIHGRQHVHYSSKKYNDYGDEIIAISSSIRTHLIHELNKDPLRIQVIPNALNFPTEIAPLPAQPVVSLIGRLNGPKGETAARLMTEVLPELLNQYVDLKFKLVGGERIESANSPIDDAWKALVAQFPGRTEHLGFVDDVQAVIDTSTVVIGAGRVALRALAAGRAVLALGESEFCGLLSTDNFDAAFLSNFGDTGQKKPWSANEFIAAFQQANKVSTGDLSLANRVRQEFSLVEKSLEIQEVYRKARMRRLVPDWMPVLMYHKVPEQPIDTPHRIFVTRRNFQKHINYLRLFNRTPVRFQDYFDLRNGKLDPKRWPKNPVVLSFDDGYRDNLIHALPLLKAKAWKATLFVLCDRIPTENFWDEDGRGLATSKLLSASELATLQREDWEIGAHTFSHSHLPKLSTEALQQEVGAGKLVLEKELNRPVLGFAYPYGDFGDREEAMARQAGYSYAVSTDTGALHQEDNLFRIFRVNIFPEESLFSFWKKTSRWYRQYYFRKRGK
ncbi:MAG: polysaccharide deacetylase family protein [Bacteroidetes bacterium]|nr:polysaccharide deacetylase family protein [Bacteroidota bacterium]